MQWMQQTGFSTYEALFHAEKGLFAWKTMWKRCGKLREVYAALHKKSDGLGLFLLLRAKSRRRRAKACGKRQESPSGCVLAAGRTCPFWLFDTQTHILAGRSKEECCMRHLLHKIVTKDGKIARLPAAGAADHSGRPGAGRKGDPAHPRRAGGGVRTGALSGLIVALDPDMAAMTAGARAQDSGRWKKDVALEIALEVEKALLARGAQVVLTRREDVCLADGDTGQIPQAGGFAKTYRHRRGGGCGRASEHPSQRIPQPRGKRAAGVLPARQRSGAAAGRNAAAGAAERPQTVQGARPPGRGTTMCWAARCPRCWWSAAF